MILQGELYGSKCNEIVKSFFLSKSKCNHIQHILYLLFCFLYLRVHIVVHRDLFHSFFMAA